jgi:hypothetical protein
MAEAKPNQPATLPEPVVPIRETVPFDSLPNAEKKVLVRKWRRQQHDELMAEVQFDE